MSRNLLNFLVLVLLLLCLATTSIAKEVPFLAGRVIDNAEVLSPSTVAELNALLKAHEDSTSNQVVVLTIPGLEGEVLEEYSVKVAQTWKIGQKGKDNGVLLLISKEDRKLRIEVGYGLEGALPDITCGSIIRNEIVPRFKSGDYDGGVVAGVNAILAAIRGEYTATEDTANEISLLGKLGVSAFFLFVVGMFTFIGIVTKGGASWFLYVFLIPFWLAFPVAIWGTSAGFVIFAIYAIGFVVAKLLIPQTTWGTKLQKSWIGRTSSGSGSGSSWSSGGSSFSGGGGSFGGGGSSGSW